MSTPCTPHDEYVIPISGSSEPTPHAIYTDGDGNEVIQCNTVKIGGGGLNN
jgi:hypothetical protein